MFSMHQFSVLTLDSTAMAKICHFLPHHFHLWQNTLSLKDVAKEMAFKNITCIRSYSPERKWC